MKSRLTAGFLAALLASVVLLNPAPSAQAAPTVTHVTVGNQPKAVVFSKDSKKAFVSNCGSDTISVFSVATGVVTSTLGTAIVGDCPSGMALSPDGSKLYVANESAHFVRVVSVETLASIGSINLGYESRFVALSPDGTKLYASHPFLGQVTVSPIHPSGNSSGGAVTVVSVFPNGGPTGMSLSPNGSKLYLVNAYDSTNYKYIAAVDTATNTVSQIDVGAKLYSVFFSSDTTAYWSSGTVGRVISGTVDPNGYLPVSGEGPFALSAESTRLLVASRTYKMIYAVDMATKTKTAEYSLGTNLPRDVAASADGSVIYTVNDSNVSIITLLTPRTITFGATTTYSLPYGSTQQLTATVSAGSAEGTISYSNGSSTACNVNSSTGLVTMTAGTGSCVISASVTAGATYGPASTTTQVTITPSKIPLTIRANANSPTYPDPVIPSFTLTSGSPINSDSLASVTYNFAGTGSTTYSAQTAPTNAGSYTVTPSAAAGSTGLTASNYDITYEGTSFSLSKASRSLAFDPVPASSYNLAYGDTLQATAKPTAGVGDGTITYSSSNTSACTVSSSGLITAVSSSGSCIVSASIADGLNYFGASTTTQVVINGTIQAITVKATSPSVNYGTLFTATATVTAGKLFGAQQLDNANMTFYFEGTNGTVYPRTTVKPANVGNYTITPESLALTDGGQASDYNVTYEPGLLTISKASRNVGFTAVSYNLTYGQSQQLALASYPGDGVVTYSLANGSDACVVDSVTGVVSVTAALGRCDISATIAEGTNHLTATTSTPVTITVSKRLITLTSTSPSVTVGGTVTPGFTVTSGSLAFTDSISGLTYNYAGTGYASSTTAPTAIGTYSVTPSAAVFSEGVAGNYVITYAPGTLSIVAKTSRTLSFTTLSYSLEYGDTQTVVATPTAGATDGTLTYSDGSSTACDVDASTGVVTVTAPSGTCAISASITEGVTHLAAATTTAVNVTVSVRAITVSVNDLTLAYGADVTPVYTLTTGSLAGSDAISGVSYEYEGTGATTYAASSTAPSDAGTYTVTPSQLVFSTGSLTNYDITYEAGELTIEEPVVAGVEITMSASVGASLAGSTVSFDAWGLKTTASYTVILRSEPQTLASGTATGGSMSGSAVIPAGLESGWHTVTFSSTDALGAPVSEVMYFKISASGTLLETSNTMPADFNSSKLGNTGNVLAPYLGVSALLLLVGVSIVGFAAYRRRQA